MANSLSDVLTVLNNGVQAINNLAKNLNTVVTATSSLGTVTIHLTQVSS